MLAFVPLCYEFNSLYSANSSCCDSFWAHWGAILDLVLCIFGQNCGTSEEFDTPGPMALLFCQSAGGSIK